jgi:glycolate oxidase iron-sulfur subunit
VSEREDFARSLAREGVAIEDGPGGLALARPTDAAGVARVLSRASSEGRRVVPIGFGAHLAAMRPGLPGGGCDLLLSTAALRAIVAYEPGDGTLTAQAGCTLADLTATVRGGGHRLTPDVACPERATLGGVIASGRSGLDRERYGPVRHHVLGLSVALADGTITKSGGRLVKNVTGFDLHRLHCGARGTLGVILEASLRLFPEPEEERALVVRGGDLEAAVEAAARLRSLRCVPLATVIEDRLEQGKDAASLPRRSGASSSTMRCARARSWVRGGARRCASARHRRRVFDLSERPGVVTSSRRYESPPSPRTCRKSRAALLPRGRWPLRAQFLVQPAVAHIEVSRRRALEREGELVPLAQALARELAPLMPSSPRTPLPSGARGTAPARSDGIAWDWMERVRSALDPRATPLVQQLSLPSLSALPDILETSPAADPARAIVDYAKSLDCIHCGLCLTTCPTYQLTGAESSSPRGRVHLMRAVAEGRLAPGAAFEEEMEFCLVCRHCESVCPAGVQFGAMMEVTRHGLVQSAGRRPLERALRWLGFRVILVRRSALRLAISALGLAQRTGVLALAAPVFGPRGKALASFPRVPRASEREPLPPRTGSIPRAAAVALLEGCVMPELYGRVNRASAACLAAAGVECRTAPGHVCCGALHAHNGDLDGARSLARSTIEAFDRVREENGSEPLPVVVNSAGCGAHMKEYERLLEHDPAWRDRARAFSVRVVDFAQYLAVPSTRERLAAALVARGTETITYDDPCHLCHGQQIRSQPRVLLDLLPGARRVELEASESCCGSAGIYSLLRPEDSARILDKKLDALRASGAAILVTANPGCQLQWESGVKRAGLAVDVVHLAELLARHLAASGGVGVPDGIAAAQRSSPAPS